MDVVDFSVDFCGGVFGRKMQKKNQPEIRQPKTKIRRRMTPPPRNPPARPKSPSQNLLTNPPVKPPSTRRVFFDWEGLLLEASSEHGFWDTLWLPSGHGQAPMLKCTCNPSAAAGGKDKVCCAPFQTTLLVKSVRFEKKAPKNKNIRHATANSGNPKPKVLCLLWSLRMPCFLSVSHFLIFFGVHLKIKKLKS